MSERGETQEFLHVLGEKERDCSYVTASKKGK